MKSIKNLAGWVVLGYTIIQYIVWNQAYGWNLAPQSVAEMFTDLQTFINLIICYFIFSAKYTPNTAPRAMAGERQAPVDKFDYKYPTEGFMFRTTHGPLSSAWAEYTPSLEKVLDEYKWTGREGTFHHFKSGDEAISTLEVVKAN